jgi:transcriptional regulator with AAA-type ATPase domain
VTHRDDSVVASPATAAALRLLDAYARAQTPVVFVGETGTAKLLGASRNTVAGVRKELEM